jgi:hypothetical protein
LEGGKYGEDRQERREKRSGERRHLGSREEIGKMGEGKVGVNPQRSESNDSKDPTLVD